MSQEQPVADQQPMAEAGAKEEKKPSVLKKVKDKARDKVKRLGSKLKPKSHEHDDEAKKRELVDQSAPGDGAEEEEEDEEPEEIPETQAPVDSKDLNVPLDEYALIKQKEAENRDQEASSGKNGLEDNLTDGLSSQAIAEQEPEESQPQALHAVPTEYHYKGDNSGPSDSQTKESAATEDKPREAEPGEKDKAVATEEEPRAPAGSPEGVFASTDSGSPQFSAKDVEDLSSSNVYTGEPDVKLLYKDNEASPPSEDSQQSRDVSAGSDKTAEASKEVPEAEKPEHESQSGVVASGNLERGEPDSIVDAKGDDHQELKEREVSAGSKLDQETAANANTTDDNPKNDLPAGKSEEKPFEEEKQAGSSDVGEKPAAAETETTNREVNNENFADAKPEMESADKALQGDAGPNADNPKAQDEVKESSEVSTEPQPQEEFSEAQDKKDEVSAREAPETKEQEIPVSEQPRSDEKLETGSDKHEENPSKENEPPASTENSPGIWQRLTKFKDNITSKPGDENQDIKTEQDRIIDEKSKEV